MPDATADNLQCRACGAVRAHDASWRQDNRITIALMAIMAVLTMVTFVRVVQTRRLETVQAAATAAE